MGYYIYIVECSDKSLYTGTTDNIEKRIKKHNLGKGAKSIKGKLPVKLVYFEEYNNKTEALKRESEIKSWPRIKKLELVYPRE